MRLAGGVVYTQPPQGGPGPMISVAQQQQAQPEPQQAGGQPPAEPQWSAQPQQLKRKLPQEFAADPQALQQQQGNGGTGATAPGNQPPAHDVYRMRQKQRSMADP